jgi:hypothetical protein
MGELLVNQFAFPAATGRLAQNTPASLSAEEAWTLL